MTCDIKDGVFDLYEFHARVEAFLKKQLFPDRRILQVQLVCEELLPGILLRAFPRADISILME